MPVEIRELVLQARVLDDPAPKDAQIQDLHELKEEILQECERMIRDALKARRAR